MRGDPLFPDSFNSHGKPRSEICDPNSRFSSTATLCSVRFSSLNRFSSSFCSTK
ncbi:hypothetical protein E2542_SST22769 [Spatholobus suberectus]|nr:hypothetical protein E2542_SST22769 [Spatholobus suberectus]